MNKINASIVLFNINPEKITRTISSILNTKLTVRLFLVDNSPKDNLKELEKLDSRIEYIFNASNIGYGAAHNIAIRKTLEEGVHYHLVLNPDIYFEYGVLEELYEIMENNPKIGNIMPKVLYPDGDIQYLCKLLPTPMDLIIRRFIPIRKIKEIINERYELRWTGYRSKMNIPCLSGCFMFLRTKALKEIGLFDENIFMYLEDVDLNRRIHTKYDTIFYPGINIYHEYGKESYKSIKLLVYHIKSTIYYFNKYGWFFDLQRRQTNKKTLKELFNKENL